MADAHNMRVFLQYIGGNVKIIQVDLNTLSQVGILEYQGRFFVFSYFVHGENAIQFTETLIGHIPA